MRGADASAGTIKSGGKTRRAAKMVILDVDHPDVEDFIWCKAIEERKARVLRDAGFDMDLDGEDSHSTPVPERQQLGAGDRRVHAGGRSTGATGTSSPRTDGSVIRTVPARDLFRQIAHAAWECADPGLQYDTTINRWHTAPNTGRINGSNPCSEYVHLDNSACNLACINLMKFLDDDDEFDVEGFKAARRRWSSPARRSSWATPTTRPRRSARTTRAFRELGIGYANLGALLMAQGLPYDSDGGRAWAAAITALHDRARLRHLGPDRGPDGTVRRLPRERRADAQRAAHAPRGGRPHRRGASCRPSCSSAAQEAWDQAVDLAEPYGVRNSQATRAGARPAPSAC